MKKWLGARTQGWPPTDRAAEELVAHGLLRSFPHLLSIVGERDATQRILNVPKFDHVVLSKEDR